MQLPLHVTCSCIRSFYSLYFDIVLLLGTFLIVSFSPLSLLFALVCFYGTQKQIYSIPEPSSFQGIHFFWSYTFFIRFHDEKAKSDFFENFSWGGIHSECQVILSDFSNTDLPTVIHSRKWESLCDILITCPSVLIQEFYSNMHGFDFSVPLFSTYIPRVEHPNCPDCERLRTMSKDEMISAFCEHPADWGDH